MKPSPPVIALHCGIVAAFALAVPAGAQIRADSSTFASSARLAPSLPATVPGTAPIAAGSETGRGALIGGGFGLGAGLVISLGFLENSDQGNPSIVEYLPVMAITTGLGALLGAVIGAQIPSGDDAVAPDDSRSGSEYRIP